MSKNMRVDDVVTLLKYIGHGYTFTVEEVLKGFSLSRSQYYEYVSPKVRKVSISKSRRMREDLGRYIEHHISVLDPVYKDVLVRVYELKLYTLINPDEVFIKLFKSDMLQIEYFNVEQGDYQLLSKEHVLNHYEDMFKVLLDSEIRQNFDLRKIEVKEKDVMKTRNALKITFLRNIKKFNHYRVIVQGVYCYSLKDSDYIQIKHLLDKVSKRVLE